MTLGDLLTIGGGAIVVAVIVQLIKPFVAERLVPLAAVGIGILLAVAASAILGQVTPEALGNAALAGLLAGASAVGIYNVQKPVGLLGPKE